MFLTDVLDITRQTRYFSVISFLVEHDMNYILTSGMTMGMTTTTNHSRWSFLMQ